MKIVLYPPVEERLRVAVQRTAPDAEVLMPQEDAVLGAVAEADVFFGHHTHDIIRGAGKLKWIQSTSAGMDALLFPEIVDSDMIVTNASGVHAIQVAEHAWALTTALFRGLPGFFKAQCAHEWNRLPVDDIYGKTIGIIGLGGIGRHYARLARAYETRILALDIQAVESPDYVDAVWGFERLDEILKVSDVIFLACPHTSETDKLINRRTLALMKERAYLLNTARGRIVDESALIEALKAGRIAGAALDVFEEEPLPPESPLWEMENVIVTPHTAGASPNRYDRTVAFFCKNLERYLAGKSLINEVDKSLGYPSGVKRV